MSFRVLVIPEDPLQNGHILKPLVQAIMQDAGRPAAKVKLLTKPRVRGYGQAVSAIRNELSEIYRFVDLWVFFPDADRAGTRAMQNLEKHVSAKGITLFCCAAQPELEIYACVAFHDEVPATWKEVRTHPRLKEKIFEPLLRKHGDPQRPGKGRDLMIHKSIKNLQRLFQLCPELRRLRDRIATHLQKNRPMPQVQIPIQAARRSVSAVNRWGRLGEWDFLVCRDPQSLGRGLSMLVDERRIRIRKIASLVYTAIRLQSHG